MKEVYALRRERLRHILRREGLDALFVSSEANRYYLSGFELHDAQMNESSGRLLICEDGTDWLFTDARFEEAAVRLWDAKHVHIYAGNAAADMNAFIAAMNFSAIGFEADTMAVSFYEEFQDRLPLLDADGLVEELRVIKDADEIARLKRSCALNHKLMEYMPNFFTEGTTELTVAWEIEKFFRENGASEMAFSSIVAFGKNAAMCHAIPAAVPLRENTPVLIDTGCRLDDYNSDQTRCYWVGNTPTDEYKRTLELVRRAQDAAIAVLRPGVRLCDVDRAARAVFEAAGEAKHFNHGLGHGVGLQTHEAPRLNGYSMEVATPGMIVTVEPGLYYPEWGGIRWEYMMLCTEDGAEQL